MRLHRRGFVLGCCAAGVTAAPLFCSSSPAVEKLPQTYGCCISAQNTGAFFAKSTGAEAFRTGDEKLQPTSASAQLDYALAQTLAMLCTTFSVLPGFSYFQETDEKDWNAFATDRPLLKHTDGTVLFGLSMLGHLLGTESRPDAAIVAVCAHEFGHIVAMKHDLNRQLSPDPTQPFRSEQFADFISGFFGGLRQKEDADFPAMIFAMTMRKLGGDTRGDHGTHAERGRAVLEGFKAAKTRSLSVSEGIDEGFRFAMAA